MRTLYRVIKGLQPTLADFEPEPVARPLRPELAQLTGAISFWQTLGQARRQARRFPHLAGRAVVAVELDEADIRIERTTPISGHYSVWADATTLMAAVVAVLPMEERS